MTHLAKQLVAPTTPSKLSRLHDELSHNEKCLSFYKQVLERGYLEKVIKEEHAKIRQRINYISFLREARKNAPSEHDKYFESSQALLVQIKEEQTRLQQAGKASSRIKEKKQKENPQYKEWFHLMEVSKLGFERFAQLIAPPPQLV